MIVDFYYYFNETFVGRYPGAHDVRPVKQNILLFFKRNSLSNLR